MHTRRSFVKIMAATSMGTAITGVQPLLAWGNKETASVPRKVYVFSKHLQWLNFPEMAKTAKEIGFDGIDLTVRPKGHVLPERVKQDLPDAIKAIRDSGLLADRMTTAITDPDDKTTIDILETASLLGIKSYRLGWLSYNPSISIQENLPVFNKKLKKLASLNKDLGITADYQNHAGEMAGGPVWDIAQMLEGIDPAHVGVRYDIRHATAEGGKSWPLGMKLLAEKINSLDIKDFIWKENGGKWQPYSVPLGNGMVDFERYFQIIKQLNIKRDFTIHMEYPLGGAENGTDTLSCSPDVVTSAMKNDLTFLRRYL